jgi:hypothetical protein
VHRYLLYGLTLEAERPLPELLLSSGLPAEMREAAPPEHGSPGAELSLRWGVVEAPPKSGGGGRAAPQGNAAPTDPSARAAAEERDDVGFVERLPDGALYSHIVGAARFLVRGGREVVIDPEPGSDPDHVRHLLLGPVLAQALWQRGLFALHACVLQLGTRRFAFVGASGEGKSTLAIALHKAGHTLVCDDVAMLEWEREPVQVRPAFPRLRAHADTLEQLGEDRTRLAQAYRELPKWLLPARSFAAEPGPLHAVYVLTTGETLHAERLGKAQAMMELLHHTYYAEQFVGLHGAAQHMRMAGKMASTLPVYRLVRPKRWAELPDLVAFLEQRAEEPDEA